METKASLIQLVILLHLQSKMMKNHVEKENLRSELKISKKQLDEIFITHSSEET